MQHHDGGDDERIESDVPATLGRRRLAAAVGAGDRVLHALGKCVFFLAPVLMLSVLVLGLGYVRLRHGPVALKFLVAPIERGIDAELDGNSVRVDDVLMSLSETGGIEFRLRNVRLLEADGDTVASAPLAAVQISTAALWSGHIVPSRVELIEPRLFLFYSDGGGLSLSFPKPLTDAAGEVGAWTTETNVPPNATPESAPLQVPTPTEARRPPAGPLKRIDLARVVTETSARARRRLDASSYLKEFGLRNATVVLEYAGRSTEWRVPSLVMDLRHDSNRSVIAGSATIASGGRPWELSFETNEAEGSRTLNLKMAVRDLVPRSLAPAVPQLSLLQAFDMPVAGKATLELSSDGDIRASTLGLEIGKGSLRLPALPEAPLEVDGGTLKVAYDGAAQKVTLSPSTLRWRGSRITLTGTLASEGGPDSRDPHPAWTYQINANEGVFAAEEFAVRPVALQSLRATGRILPRRGEIVLADFSMKAGDAEIALQGDFIAGVDPASTRLEGRLSAMRLDTLKALWPKAIAPGAREWIGEQLLRADVEGGTFRFISGEQPAAEGLVASTQHTLAFALEAANLEMRVIDNMPTVTVPRAMVRIDNDRLAIDMPEAAIQMDAQRTVPLKDGLFSATDIMGDLPLGEIAFASQTSLAMVLELLERSPLKALEEAGLPREGIEGQFAGQFKVGLPLLAELPMSAIKLQAKARISEGRANALLGPYKVEGASIDLDITEKAVDANGEMLVNGTLAKLAWQRIFDAPLDKQPPLRITATLDDNDRNQLGLDVNDIVQGEVPVEITVTQGVRDEPEIRLRADLGNADLVLANMSWRKPPGRAATLQCDIATGRTHKIELQNFKVAGDDVAIEGWAAIGADNRLREFYFPDFSLNVITRMEVQGTLGSDNIWKVKATGPSFDGRDFFRSLFSLGQLAKQHSEKKKPGDGIDLEAQIGTVIGFSDVSVRGVKLTLSKRGDKLSALDVRGTLDGGKPLVVQLRQEQGQPRKLLADSTDAGQAFKLIDFYPKIEGGRVRLEVNMDGSGPAEKTGTLWVEQFRILGDPVVSEVFSGAASESGAKSKKRQVVRQVFDFDLMYVPFSVGYGQFVMGKSSLRGPLLGATISGKVDFKSRRVNLGGSYIPLQGLQALPLCQIPIVGTIITGQGCEGVSGITFAIQGPMDRPEVIANPLSMLAPGIFREIFQMTNPNQKVLRRDEAPTPDSGKNARSSSTTIDAPPPVSSGTIDGWSSQTIESMPTRKE